MDTCKLLSQRQQPRGGNTLMKWRIIATATMLATLFAACTKTIYIPLEQRHTEFISLKDTIVEVITPGESHSNHTGDTTSTLSSRGATSTATISNGKLSHTLIIHPRRDSIAIQVREVHTIDSIPYPSSPSEEQTDREKRHARDIATAITLTALIVAILICKHRDSV